MKVGLIFLITGIFLLLILIYQLQSFSPFQLDKIEDLILSEGIQSGMEEEFNNLIKEKVVNLSIFEYLSDQSYTVFILLNLTIFTLFNSIHIFVDKLFFKTIFQKPNYALSIRRGIIVCISLSLIIYMKLLRVELSNILLIPIAAIILEVILTSVINKKVGN